MNILLIIHIFSALTGLALSGYAYLQPSRERIRFAVGLAVVTLATGTYLIWTHPAHAAQSVVTGVVYLALILAGIIAADLKLKSKLEQPSGSEQG